MKPLEVFKVESPDTTGADAYELVTRDVFADLELTTVLGRLWIYIDPTEPVFIFCTLIRTGLPPIRVRDVANVAVASSGADQVVLDLSNEKYIPQLLSTIRARYGNKNISQPDRTTMTIETEKATKEEIAESLAEVVIADPRRQIDERLADALLRITPEGFRVRHHASTGEEMLFVASEEAMRSEWIEKAEEMMNQLKSQEV